MAEPDERAATASGDSPSGDSAISGSTASDSGGSDSPDPDSPDPDSPDPDSPDPDSPDPDSPDPDSPDPDSPDPDSPDPDSPDPDYPDSTAPDSPAFDSPATPGAQAPAIVREGRVPRTPLVGDSGPDDFSGLLATLGHYLDRHAPDEVMVLLRAELERREIQAYASGWRDAAARYEPALEEARAANGRALRLVRRTPGQAAVIPLRQDARDAQDNPRAAPRAPRGGDAGRGAGERAAPGSGVSGADPPDGRPPGTAPALVPKSRTSRVPTIPRLRTTLRRPSGGGRTVTPDGGAL